MHIFPSTKHQLCGTYNRHCPCPSVRPYPLAQSSRACHSCLPLAGVHLTHAVSRGALAAQMHLPCEAWDYYLISVIKYIFWPLFPIFAFEPLKKIKINRLPTLFWWCFFNTDECTQNNQNWIIHEIIHIFVRFIWSKYPFVPLLETGICKCRESK